jgi:hypothetical protein
MTPRLYSLNRFERLLGKFWSREKALRAYTQISVKANESSFHL